MSVYFFPKASERGVYQFIPSSFSNQAIVIPQ